MIRYPLLLVPDDNDTFLVTCPDLPGVTTWGLDEAHACVMGARAVEEAVAGRLWDGRPVPLPGAGGDDGAGEDVSPDGDPAVDPGADPGALPALLRLSAPLDRDTTTALLLHWLEREEPPRGHDAPAAPVGRAGVRAPYRLDLAPLPDAPGHALAHRARPARRPAARR